MDSTRVELINKSLDLLTKKMTEKPEENSIWPVVFPVIIGAILALTAQIVLEKIKTCKEKKSKIRELASKGRAKTYLISQMLKDLAMYKAHKQYYLKAYKIGIDKEDSYKKQYEKGQEQRAIEAKLDEIISAYFEIVAEYYILSKKGQTFKETYEEIFSYKHPKPIEFSTQTWTELVVELNKEEERLNEIYKDFFEKFNNIQTSMDSDFY